MEQKLYGQRTWHNIRVNTIFINFGHQSSICMWFCFSPCCMEMTTLLGAYFVYVLMLIILFQSQYLLLKASHCLLAGCQQQLSNCFQLMLFEKAFMFCFILSYFSQGDCVSSGLFLWVDSVSQNTKEDFQQSKQIRFNKTQGKRMLGVLGSSFHIFYILTSTF